MVQNKIELVTTQDKELLEGLLLSAPGSMTVPFLGKQSHQTRTLMWRLKVAGKKAEGLAKTSKKLLVQPRSAHLEVQVYISRSFMVQDPFIVVGSLGIKVTVHVN